MVDKLEKYDIYTINLIITTLDIVAIWDGNITFVLAFKSKNQNDKNKHQSKAVLESHNLGHASYFRFQVLSLMFFLWKQQAVNHRLSWQMFF